MRAPDRTLLAAYPERDRAFVTEFESSFASVSGRIVDDEGILAACEAMLRASYPLAVLRRRVAPSESRWEAFRDDSVFDEEMVRRGRAGDLQALEDLYERHHPLSYAVAAQLAGPTEAAMEAVAEAFAAVVHAPWGAWPVRIRLAIATYDAALRITGRPGLGARAAVARAVVHLAAAHSLQQGEVAAILRLHNGEVATLAVEGLRTLRAEVS